VHLPVDLDIAQQIILDNIVTFPTNDSAEFRLFPITNYFGAKIEYTVSDLKVQISQDKKSAESGEVQIRESDTWIVCKNLTLGKYEVQVYLWDKPVLAHAITIDVKPQSPKEEDLIDEDNTGNQKIKELYKQIILTTKELNQTEPESEESSFSYEYIQYFNKVAQTAEPVLKLKKIEWQTIFSQSKQLQTDFLVTSLEAILSFIQSLSNSIIIMAFEEEKKQIFLDYVKVIRSYAQLANQALQNTEESLIEQFEPVIALFGQKNRGNFIENQRLQNKDMSI